MTIAQLLILAAIGLLSGLLSGTLGIGGATVVIPALVYFIGMSQHEAQGTSLAFMVPPVGILAAWNYYKEGYVNWKIALVLAIMFFAGAYFGSLLSINIPDKVLKRIFGLLLLAISAKMILSK